MVRYTTSAPLVIIGVASSQTTFPHHAGYRSKVGYQRRVRTAKRQVSYGRSHGFNSLTKRPLTRVNPDEVLSTASRFNDSDGIDESMYDGINLDLNSNVQEEYEMEEGTYQPLRITPVLAEEFTKYLTAPEREYLLDEILSPAIESWSEALWVSPVNGPLIIDSSQLWDEQTCGPGLDSGFPSPYVLPEHFDVGLNNTDVVIYVSVSFTFNEYQGSVDDPTSSENSTSNDPLKNSLIEDLQEGEEIHADYDSARVPTTMSNILSTAPSTTPSSLYIRGNFTLGDEDLSESINSTINDSIQGGEYVPSSAPSILLRGNWTSPHCVDSHNIASASYCNTDQFDRPVAGSIHFCINLGEGNEDENGFFHPSQRLFNIKATIHEIAHILGFNPQSLAHFRYLDGSPRTQRNENGDVPDVEVECTGLIDDGVSKRTAVVPLPDESILNFRNTDDGYRIASVVSENVKMFVRNHFDCDQIYGADFEIDEDEQFLESTCIGNHWDRRMFKQDLMNPIVDSPLNSTKLFITPLTLAYFMDSGWYRANLNYSAPVGSWGRGSGCAFSLGGCDFEDSLFCNEVSNSLDSYGCTFDHMQKATCGISLYTSKVGSVRNELQHFGIEEHFVEEATTELYETWLGGNDPYLDYCPVYETDTDFFCTQESSEVLRKSPVSIFP